MAHKDYQDKLPFDLIDIRIDKSEVTFINDHAAKLFNLKVGDALTELEKRIHPMHQNRLQYVLDSLKYDANDPVLLEFTLPQMYGEARYLDCKVIPIDGNDICFHMTGIDVTRHRRHANDFKYMIDCSTDAILVHRGHEICYGNPSFLKLTGLFCLKDLLQESNISRFVHLEDVSRINKNISDRLRGKNPLDEFSFKLQHEEFGHIGVHCKVDYVDWEGEPAFMSTLTPMEQVEESSSHYAKTEALLTHIFNLTPDMIFIINAQDGQIQMANDRALEVTGYSREEIVERNIFQSGILSSPRMNFEILKTLKQQISLHDLDAFTNTKLGREIQTSVSMSYCPLESEKIAICVIRDVTDRQTQAENMKRSMFEAEEANRAKSEFLANMSHELRTPLNAILGFAQMIRDKVFGEETDRYANYANDIHHSGIHLLNIINDILDLSKIEAGAMEMKGESVDVQEVFKEAYAICYNNAVENKLHLQIDHPNERLKLVGNKQRFLQVLLNIISNSLKFTPEGGTISVKATRVYNQDKVRIWISDTGIGMTESEIVTALQPFGQASSAYTRGHEGTGLGLPLVNSFTEAMGGKMTIKSSPGLGTTVNLVFHLSEETEDEQKAD